jgi:hypothetical protein
MSATISYILGAGFIGIIGWIFHTNSKVNVIDQKHQDLKELIELMNENVGGRLERIERALNGALRRRDEDDRWNH